jgi:hypothetical protein
VQLKKDFHTVLDDTAFASIPSCPKGISRHQTCIACYDGFRCRRKHTPCAARRDRSASAQGLLRFICEAARLNYATRSTVDHAQPFNEQGTAKKAACNFDAFAYRKAGSKNGSCFRLRENHLAVR